MKKGLKSRVLLAMSLIMITMLAAGCGTDKERMEVTASVAAQADAASRESKESENRVENKSGIESQEPETSEKTEHITKEPQSDEAQNDEAQNDEIQIDEFQIDESKIVSPILAYHQFLEGKRKVYVKEDHINNMSNVEQYHIGEEGCSIQELLQHCRNAKREMYEMNELDYSSGQDMITKIEYAYMDYGKDDVLDLAVRFVGLGMYTLNDDSSETYVISYRDGRLEFCEFYASAARNVSDLYYYGYSIGMGFGSAVSTNYTYYCLDAEGEQQLLVRKEELVGYGVYELNEEAFAQTFEEEENGAEACGQLTAYVWELDGEKYYTYRILEGEYRGKCESFLTLCEQDGITFSTEEEMEELIKKRREELGIQEEWLEEKALVWHTYYDEKYKDYVKMIHLSEHNRQRKATEEYPMDDLWVICETGKADGEELNSYIDSRAEGALQGLSWEWEESVGYAVMDYCAKNNISAKNWIIKDVMSIEDDRYLFFLQGEEERELYLLINPMAYRLGIPEVTEYIVAMELPNTLDESLVVEPRPFCASKLDWISYEKQMKVDVEEQYEVLGTGDGLYSWKESDGVYAMNVYLKWMGAEPSEAWRLDSNSVYVGKRGIGVLSYSNGEQTVILMLDGKNKVFSILKGIDA